MKQDGDPKFSVPSNQPKNLMKLRDHIRVIMCNLICAEQTDPNLWISFLNGHGHLKKNPSLKGFQFSIRNVNKVVGFLEKHGFIQIQKGYAPPKGEKGCKPEASKMKATAKLQEALAY
ncbi:hypothetical protein, partial [Acinetobacter sp.]|uniref:hypothetical protein n=1 Tax=Acinetobacter sp. TaxID=472 RepID=UPI003D03FBBB